MKYLVDMHELKRCIHAHRPWRFIWGCFPSDFGDLAGCVLGWLPGTEVEVSGTNRLVGVLTYSYSMKYGGYAHPLTPCYIAQLF
jgi:hypothetical protein